MRSICTFISLLLVFPDVSGVDPGLTTLSVVMYNQKKTWVEAQAFCRENHIDLLTIESEVVNELLDGFEGWIGLYRENVASPWKWSEGDKSLAFNFNLDDKEPNKHCTAKEADGKWENRKCDERFRFLCMDSSLFLVKENKTWEEALNHCRSLGGEDLLNKKPLYDLATLISKDDRDHALQKAQRATTEEVWTGLRFLGDTWYWMSGEEVESWELPNCPAFRCGVLEKNNNTLFGIRDCNERRNFFCYERP